MHGKPLKRIFQGSPGLGVLAILCLSIPAAAQDANLPDGPGKDKVVTACNGCHNLGEATSQHLNAQHWADIVSVMVEYGAPVADADFSTVVKYLATNFGPEPAAGQGSR